MPSHKKAGKIVPRKSKKPQAPEVKSRGSDIFVDCVANAIVSAAVDRSNPDREALKVLEADEVEKVSQFMVDTFRNSRVTKPQAGTGKIAKVEDSDSQSEVAVKIFDSTADLECRCYNTGVIALEVLSENAEAGSPVALVRLRRAAIYLTGLTNRPEHESEAEDFSEIPTEAFALDMPF